MSSTIDQEELELSISITPNPRRSSAKPPDPQNDRITQVQNRPKDGKTTQRMGQYTVVKTLGEGSFGKVKLAVHQISGQKVALKIINRKKLVTRDMAGRIEREIQYLQLLRHPHIIKLYTVITTPTEINMVLEFAGGELFEYIVSHGKMLEKEARKFFQQLVCAVEYCHRHKIVHRDLKPENLLLDDNMNLKIADFGLSNIMTDGNFLKTSCGSPNYAAPEVISGKLYAGPEVDVWSCGVIFYVLLVGRLPFDDEYIPTLFKKIAAGNYSIPNWISHEATSLIKKMLMVNPVHRITIAEIRQDPWFNEDLPSYLQAPREEFYDTGVDPNKAIDPKRLAPDQPQAVVQKLHDTVVGKLGKTMGYAKNDVQEALAKDEPSAIKDAYLIVRENQLMKENPIMTKDTALHDFLATSPPSHEHNFMSTSIPTAMAPSRPQVIPPQRSQSPQPPQETERNRQGSTSSTQNLSNLRSPGNAIAVLPSSLPDYHRAYMKGHPKPQPSTNQPEHSNEPLPTITEQTSEEKAATARRLKPHARNLKDDRSASKPEGMTPLPAKKPRPTKWQFGIRSRNQPAEAMLAIYKALRAMDAEWETQRIRRAGGRSRNGSRGSSQDSRSRSRSRSESRSRSTSDSSRSSFNDDQERSVSPGHRQPLSVRNGSTGADSSLSRGRPRRHYDQHNDWGYSIPEDPWVINARFKKEGMFPPGVVHPSSTHSSRVDLHDSASLRRRSSTNTSHSSLNHDASTHPEAMTSSITGDFSKYPQPDESVYVYMSIQLYSIDRDFFVVDFKCAGYERLVQNLVREIKATAPNVDIGKQELENATFNDGDTFEWRRLGDGEPIPEDVMKDKGSAILRERQEEVGTGRAQGEKRATSPFPFLDVASQLILQLSEP